MSQGNATPILGATSGLRIEDEIGTYPPYTTVASTTLSFSATHPNVIEVSDWPLTAPETEVAYGQSFWMFDKVNGKLAFGKWSLVDTTLFFYPTDGFPKWNTNVSTGEAKIITDRDVRHFDQCSVRNTGSGDVSVDGSIISSQQYLNIVRQGNAQKPIVIDATNGAIAQITTGLI